MLFSIDTIHEDSNYRIKDKEKAKVFQSLCISGNNTRKMIAETLGIRPITVSKVVKELIEDRLVVEGDSKVRNSKGRPEVRLHPDYHRLSAISLHVLSRELKGTLVNLNGEVLETQSIQIHENADNAVMTDSIRRILDILIIKLTGGSELIGIGASLPGTVNAAQGRWISSARWPNFSSICLTELVSDYKVPLSLYRSLDPELEFLLFRNERYRQGGTLLFHWGYGIGSAYSSDGRVLKSGLGRFGEVGHWQVTQNANKLCKCGLSGCLETEAALWAILPAIREVYPEAPEDESEFTGFIRDINIENLEVLKRALGYVTISLANLYKVFYPDRILLYGPLIEKSPILHDLKRGFKALIPEYARPSVELEAVSVLQGAVLGSVYHLFRDALRPLLRTRGNV